MEGRFPCTSAQYGKSSGNLFWAACILRNIGGKCHKMLDILPIDHALSGE